MALLHFNTGSRRLLHPEKPLMPRFLNAASLPVLMITLTAQVRAPIPRSPSPTAQPSRPAAEGLLADGINNQRTASGDRAAQKRALVRAQVLLDRRHFSPGVIDGATGSNMRLAVSSFQAAEDLPVNGTVDAATWERLTSGDARPVLRAYTITAQDVAGPFAAPVTPGDYATMAARPSMTWTSVTEALAERSHMDEALLKAINPGADFSRPGTQIVVADTARSTLPTITEVVVEKGKNELRAMDVDGKIVAVYPATVGSSERPAPTGTYAVRAVATAPNYTFDPSRLTFSAKGGKTDKLTIKPGPNNPVGSTWIDLTLDTYGIHGTPDPRSIGKVASHGCVRLTNWDAAELANAVKEGTRVAIND